MGATGSDNRCTRWDKKTVVEDCLCLDANRWMQQGFLAAGVQLSGSQRWTYPSGNGFSIHYQVNTLELICPFVQLQYSWVWQSTQEHESADYRLALTTTRPPFGGLRWWFVCPLLISGRPCLRRVGKLYLPPQARYFGCRRCHQLTYTSCQESHKWDALFRSLAGQLGTDFQTVRKGMTSFGKAGPCLPGMSGLDYF